MLASVARPFHVYNAVAPPPAAVAIAAPGVPSVSGAAAKPHSTSPAAESATRTVSREPSAFGEKADPLMLLAASVGATVSTVTPNAASWAGVTGLADGAE